MLFKIDMVIYSVESVLFFGYIIISLFDAHNDVDDNVKTVKRGLMMYKVTEIHLKGLRS